MGLADGSILRLQGGARFGVEGAWNAVRMTTVFTGLLYDDVLVSGGMLQNAPNPLIIADQGKLRGEGILTLNFYQGDRVSYLLQADLWGGQGLFAPGERWVCASPGEGGESVVHAIRAAPSNRATPAKTVRDPARATVGHDVFCLSFGNPPPLTVRLCLPLQNKNPRLEGQTTNRGRHALTLF